MATITFSCAQAYTAFASMAEGMEEVQRDTGDAASLGRADALLRLLDACNATELNPNERGQVAVVIDDRDAQEAQGVIDNCLDASAADYGVYRDAAVAEHGEDADDGLYPGEATIAMGEPERINQHHTKSETMDLRGALRHAIAMLSASPVGSRDSEAHDWLVELYQQRGCDHLGEGEDGLVENCQIFIRG